MDPQADLTQRLDRLERRLRRTNLCVTLALAALGALALGSWQSKPSTEAVLRARGLVIEDASGRERILLGAPIPQARNRVRTDPERVASNWGPRFPKEYLDTYKSYRHDMNGLLVLDADGFDRLALGDPVPDPNIGQRIGASTGLALNDEQGFERAGFGLLKVGGHYRAALGLDSAQGTESLMLTLLDEGGVGLVVADQDRRLFLGSAPADFPLTGRSSPTHGLVLLEGDEVKRVVDATGDK